MRYQQLFVHHNFLVSISILVAHDEKTSYSLKHANIHTGSRYESMYDAFTPLCGFIHTLNIPCPDMINLEHTCTIHKI